MSVSCRVKRKKKRFFSRLLKEKILNYSVMFNYTDKKSVDLTLQYFFARDTRESFN